MEEKRKIKKEGKQTGPNSTPETLIPLTAKIKDRYNSPLVIHMRKQSAHFLTHTPSHPLYLSCPDALRDGYL